MARAKPAGSSLEAERREVEETADLVLELELVGPVPSRRYGAVGAHDAVLPRVHPHLDSVPAIPMEKRGVSKPVQLPQDEKKISANASSVLKNWNLQKQSSSIKHFKHVSKHGLTSAKLFGSNSNMTIYKDIACMGRKCYAEFIWYRCNSRTHIPKNNRSRCIFSL